MEDVLLHISRFQPFLEHGFLHWNMGQEPCVRNSVKTAFDVSFEYPLRRFLFSECYKTLFYRISRRSLRSKAIRIWVRCGFRYWVQGKQVEGLHRSAFHNGNTQRALFAVVLRNI